MATRITKKLVSISGRCTRNIPQKTRVFSTSSSSFSSSDYLQTISHVPTMHFQPAIPQLPIPTLQDTCQRYLATQGAFLSPEEFEETKAIVEEFERGEGHELNIELVEQNKKNSHTSYITDSWLDMYLTYRASVVLNSNPVTLISDDARPAYMQQILRATNITVSILRFLKTLREGKLVPDVIHKNPAVTDTEEFWRSVGSLSAHEAYRHAVKSNAYPLDMSQFQRIFNATRIPQPIRDELFCDVTQRHVLVMCRGRMYVVDVLEEDGSIVSGQIIQAHLQFIFDDSASSPPQDHPVGFLTTQDRDTWTHLRKHIVELSKDNQDNMGLIDSALFCLCLEDDLSNDNVEDIKRGLYGNAGNRWFDKTIQLIVTKAGRLLINLEHSWGDGLTLKRVVTEAFQDSIDRPAVSPEGAIRNADHSKTVRKLEFSFDNVIHQGIEKAQLDHLHRTNQLNIQCMDYNKYGSTFLKGCRLSPDAVVQLAMQIAYSRITGHTAATYESCSTALYKHGRTETVRSATSETKRCAEAFNGNTSVSLAEKVSLLKACSDKHRQLSAQATAGQGWDRHLFALRVLAMKSGKSIPRLFQDSAYANINTITLSTSTIGRNTASDGAAFAPVSPTGLGVAYSVGKDGMQWTGSSYKTSPNLSDFVECIKQASDEIHEVLKKAMK